MIWTNGPVELTDSPLGTVLAQLPSGTQLVVLENSSRMIGRASPIFFSYVRLEGSDLEGWIRSSILRFLPVSVVVSTDHLIIRATPSLDGEITGQLGLHTCVDVLQADNMLGNDGVWFYVRHLSTGTEGWISADYVWLVPYDYNDFYDLSPEFHEATCPE
jgi:hypothetical protein